MARRIIFEEDNETRPKYYTPTRGESFLIGMRAGSVWAAKMIVVLLLSVSVLVIVLNLVCKE